MAYHEIPLTPMPQRFTLNLGGREISITLRWKEVREGGWSLDLDDVITDSPLIHGLPLVAGIDILGQYRHLELPFRMAISGDGMREATRDNLGRDVKIYIATEEP